MSSTSDEIARLTVKRDMHVFRGKGMGSVDPLGMVQYRSTAEKGLAVANAKIARRISAGRELKRLHL